MSQSPKTYRVFVSSASDVAGQRSVVKAAVQGSSDHYERTRSVRVEPWLWEDHVTSNIGVAPQRNITEQLGEYQIYIGIMGTRFGTPTEFFGSGTEEEFNDAIKLKQEGKIIRVAFLFKDVKMSTGSLSREDLEQLMKVNEFKNKMGPMGLYHTFSEDSELSILVQKIVSEAIDSDLELFASRGEQYHFHTRVEERGAPTLSRDFFAEVLNYIDEDLSNGGKARLTLEDVWVDPEMRTISGSGSDDPSSIQGFNVDSLVKGLSGGKSYLLYGAEKSGKTSLCRRVFVNLQALGLFPILLAPEKINNLSFPELNAASELP